MVHVVWRLLAILAIPGFPGKPRQGIQPKIENSRQFLKKVDLLTMDSRPPNSALQVAIVQIRYFNHDFARFFALILLNKYIV